MSCTITKNTMIKIKAATKKNKQTKHTYTTTTNKQKTKQIINSKPDNNTNKAIRGATQQAMKQPYILAEPTNPALVADALSCIVTFAYNLQLYTTNINTT